MDDLRLITIPISHFCEKARWALELAGLPYREEPHLQVIHSVHTWWAGHGWGRIRQRRRRRAATSLWREQPSRRRQRGCRG